MSDNTNRHSKRMARVIIALLGAVLAAGAVLLLRSGRKSLTPAIHVTGIMDGVEVDLAPKIAGRISWIACGEGGPVKKGQLVITLDSEDIRAQVMQAAAARQKAEADIGTARASVQDARAAFISAGADVKSAAAGVEMALAQQEESRREAGRAQDLYKKQFISAQARDQLVSAYDVARAAHDSAVAKLDSARARRQQAEAALDTAASQLVSSKALLREAGANLAFYRAKLDDTQIRTPVTGTVIFKAREQGETVSPGDTIMTVVDLDSLYARVDIDETRIGRVRLNGPADITLDGMPGKVFKGRVIEVGRYAEFATQRDVVRGREDIKTFRVKIKVLNDPGRILKPGMTVEVAIPAGKP
ncbi:MAG: efflux RND transporter periplasmic adaptor subunit [Nitrospiraceae bacterium]|nr:efflux RND transporter periplasmic adaptor subunit [Nitrospiraceae bacterium]